MQNRWIRNNNWHNQIWLKRKSLLKICIHMWDITFSVIAMNNIAFWKWQCAVWYTGTNTLEQPATSNFRIPEQKGSRFLWNIGTIYKLGRITYQKRAFFRESLACVLHKHTHLFFAICKKIFLLLSQSFLGKRHTSMQNWCVLLSRKKKINLILTYINSKTVMNFLVSYSVAMV